MARINPECISAAREVLGKITAQELKDYTNNVFSKARSYDALYGKAAIDRAIKEVNNSVLQDLYEEAMIKVNNTNKYDKISSLIKKGVELKNIIIRRTTNLDYNIESAQRAARLRLHNEFFKELSDEEALYIIQGANDIEIAMAIDGEETSAIAKSIAKKHYKYIDSRSAAIVDSNALPLSYINKDRSFRASHDRRKMINGGASLYQQGKDFIQRIVKVDYKKSWREFIKEHLNLEGTFDGSSAMDLNGKLDMAEVDVMLDRIYDNIVNGRSEIFTHSTVANDAEAIRRKSRMFFQWKNMQSYMTYQQKYGHGNYFSALMSDIEASANKVGMAEIMGGNPTSMFNAIKIEAFEAGTLKNLKSHVLDNYYKQVSGESNVAVSPTMAAMGSNIRSYAGMARLGRLTIQSLGDTGNVITFATEFGADYYKAYSTTLTNMFDKIPNAEREYIAKLFKLNVDSHMGYMGKFIDAATTGDITKKVSSWYYKVIGSEAFDRGNKLSSMQIIASHLFEVSEKDFHQLSTATRDSLEKYGITANEWNVLKTKNNNKLFTIDNVESLSELEIKELYEASNKFIPLHDYRNYLFRKVYSMFDVASEDSILAPNAFSRAWMTLGTRSGTYLGEGMRFMTQFKGYPLRYLERYWRLFANADSATAKMIFATQMMVATIPMSILSHKLDYLSRGKSMPDITEMNYAEALSYSLAITAPGIGVFAKILDPQNQGKDLIAGLLGGPGLQTLSDFWSLIPELAAGNTKGFSKSMKNLVTKDFLPLESFPIISPLIRKMMGEEAFLQPGQVQYYGE
jgi:hypothetical protein